ncbi:hypothetical protein KKF91_15020 [Myxococcota bacterium]|nr:hypothetical protein [Myxococcota bacterium]
MKNMWVTPSPWGSRRIWLEDLIHHYLSAANSLISRLVADYQIPDLLTGRRIGTVPRTGVSASGIEFRFHGAGCWLTDGDTIVDLDFGPDGSTNVFDAWRLHVYSEDQPDLAGVRTQTEVQDGLAALLIAGRLAQVGDSNQFRLA